MQTSLYLFASDVGAEGADGVVAAAHDRAGLDAVAPAFVYHASRDVFPHRSHGRVVLCREGGCHFDPDTARYRGLAIQPRRASGAGVGGDGLADLCRAAARRGVDVHAWTVFLHADRPGLDQWAPRNASGDPALDELCPAHPDVRAFACALAGDVARRDVSLVVAESLHFHGFEHGEHHERCLAPLDGMTRFLLGLCFCTACLDRARVAGVHGEGVRRAARERIDAVLTARQDPGPQSAPTREEAAGVCGAELDAYLTVREDTVTTLAAEVSEAVRAAGAELAFIDATGALLGYADGRPGDTLAVAAGWRIGVDAGAVARAAGELHLAAYAVEDDRVRADAAAYREAAGADGRLGAVLRPWGPDSPDAGALGRKIAALEDAGVKRLGFYHYGLLPLAALDRVATALGGR